MIVGSVPDTFHPYSRKYFGSVKTGKLSVVKSMISLSGRGAKRQRARFLLQIFSEIFFLYSNEFQIQIFFAVFQVYIAYKVAIEKVEPLNFNRKKLCKKGLYVLLLSVYSLCPKTQILRTFHLKYITDLVAMGFQCEAALVGVIGKGSEVGVIAERAQRECQQRGNVPSGRRFDATHLEGVTVAESRVETDSLHLIVHTIINLT